MTPKQVSLLFASGASSADLAGLTKGTASDLIDRILNYGEAPFMVATPGPSHPDLVAAVESQMAMDSLRTNGSFDALLGLG